MMVCPFCGSRQDIDLRKVHFRDLGSDASLSCPDCRTALNVIEIDTDPAMTIERCPACVGMFFNHGELEKLLEENTSEVILLDKQQLSGIAEHFGHEHEVLYLQCPMCHERMSHRNFGGSSGVILDHCGTHGMWVQGGELRRLLEWWAAGGKHLHQQNEQERVAKLNALRLPPAGSAMSGRRTSSGVDWSVLDTPNHDPWTHESIVPAAIEVAAHAIFGILSHFSD
jgi:Zn-finger nucleic acid-binding protein